MSVALPPNIPMDQLAIRPDKAGAQQSSPDDGAGADAFSSLMTELTTAGNGVSDRIAASASSQPTLSGDEAEIDAKGDGASADAQVPAEASGALPGPTLQPFVDPSWSTLLLGFSTLSSQSAPKDGTQPLDADQPTNDGPIEASSRFRYDGAGAMAGESGAPAAKAMSLDQALAAAARSDGDALPAASARTAARTPPNVVSPASTGVGDETAAQAIVASEPPIEPNEPAEVKPPRPAATVSTSSARREATTLDSRAEIGSGPDISDPTVADSVAGVAAASAEGRSERSADETAPETIGGVKIQSLETHLPVALSNIIIAQARSSFGITDSERPNVNLSFAPASVALDTPSQNSAASTKLLTIELEPESLGAVTVKMKMSGSNIDMQIRVDSAEALRALDATRDKLVDAMQSSGCTVESCRIQVASQVTPASSPDGSQSMTNGDGQSAASSGSEGWRQENVGREGTSHGGQDGYPQYAAGRGGEQASSDKGPDRAVDRGLYL